MKIRRRTILDTSLKGVQKERPNAARLDRFESENRATPPSPQTREPFRFQVGNLFGEQEVAALSRELMSDGPEGEKLRHRLGKAMLCLDEACDRAIARLHSNAKRKFDEDLLLGDRQFLSALVKALKASQHEEVWEGRQPKLLSSLMRHLGENHTTNLRRYLTEDTENAFQESQGMPMDDALEWTAFRKALSYSHHVAQERGIQLASLMSRPELNRPFVALMRELSTQDTHDVARKRFLDEMSVQAQAFSENRIRFGFQELKGFTVLEKFLNHESVSKRRAFAAQVQELLGWRDAEVVSAMVLQSTKEPSPSQFLQAFTALCAKRQSLSDEAMAVLAVKVARKQVDASWLTRLSLPDDLFEFLARDKQTKWGEYSQYSQLNTDAAKRLNLNRHLKGAAGEFIALQEFSKAPEFELLKRQSVLAGAIADIVLLRQGVIVGVEVKTWTKEFWTKALKEYKRFLDHGERTSAAEALEHLYKQLYKLEKRHHSDPILVVPDDLPEHVVRQLREQLELHAEGTQLRTMSAHEIEKTSKILHQAFENAGKVIS